MEQFTTEHLIIIIGVLILISAFFSGSETGMMSLNRYRMLHLAKQGSRGARNATELLKHPDRLLGVILIGNNLVNLLASALTTLLAVRLWGEIGVAIATLVLTLTILIFAEITPKTLASMRPERIAFPASYVLKPLLRLLYPVVILVNRISKMLLSLVPGLSRGNPVNEQLDSEELYTLLAETGELIPTHHRHMLLSILDLEKLSVQDVMTPRKQIVGLDTTNDIESLITCIGREDYEELPVYREDIDDLLGILKTRALLTNLIHHKPSKENLIAQLSPPYFVPENASLYTQLVNFQHERKHSALVVNKHGDIEGIITLEDILEEIVGEFSGNKTYPEGIRPQRDGSCYVLGDTPVRDINRFCQWHLPTDEAVTISGLVTHVLGTIPTGNLCMRIGSYRIETLSVQENRIRALHIMPVPGDADSDSSGDASAR